jgi:hypothetical protein
MFRVGTLGVFFLNRKQLTSDSLKNLVDHALDALFVDLKLVQYLLLELIVVFFEDDKFLFSAKRWQLSLLDPFECSQIGILEQSRLAVNSKNWDID